MSRQVHDATQDLVLHIHLLGDFRLAYDDDPVTDIDTARLQSLLAYLLLHRDAPQSRHHLAFLFWSDSTESQALTNLRHLLYQMRHALPDANRFLRIDRQTVQWQPNAPFTLDVDDFERALVRVDQAEQADNQEATQEALEEAVTLYGDDLLPSCYEDWIFPERERLRQAFTEALERLIQLLEERRDYGAAIGYAQRLVRHDPLREVTYESLSKARRRLLHRHVARALERVHRDNLEPVVARVAAHYEQADEAEQAIAYYQRAADVALTMQAEEDANRYRQRMDDLLKETTIRES